MSDRTVAGRQSDQDLVYRTFTFFPLGVTEDSVYNVSGGACTGHSVKRELPVSCSYLLDVQEKLL